MYTIEQLNTWGSIVKYQLLKAITDTNKPLIFSP